MTIPGDASIVVSRPAAARLAPIQDMAGPSLTTQCAERAYGGIKNDAPAISGRAVNILV